MISKWQWLWRQLTRKLWFRAGLLSLLAVATALIAIVLAPFIPPDAPASVGSDAVDSILHILASSLLAVTIFSLTAAVSAYGNAARSVTPRATKLLMEDPTTQNALATFLGSFLYSLVGIIALSTGIYGSEGRLVLFVVTVMVIVLIVGTLLRWIDHLSGFGMVGETTARVEQAATRAMKAHAATPHLGGGPLVDLEHGIPTDAVEVRCPEIGYVQHVDVPALAACADKHGGEVFVTALPGTFVDPSRPLARVLNIDTEHFDVVRRAFTVGDERSFDQDPRFGLSVLAEIASRALSPSMNDPGTAIDVIGRAVRVLAVWASGTDDEKPPHAEKGPVFVPSVRLSELFDDIFQPIARDGAAFLEVQLRLQKALLALATLNERYAKQAARLASTALSRAEAASLLADEMTRLRQVAAETIRIAAGCQRARR
jgi:uncharacterized membrane protein